MSADRDEQFAGMHELLNFLAAHPAIPLGVIGEYGMVCYPQNHVGEPVDMAAALAILWAIGESIGVEPSQRYGGAHIYVVGPTFRGGVSFEAVGSSAAEDFARGVGKVAGPAEGTGSATAPTESAAGVALPPADEAPNVGTPESGGTSAAVPAPVATGDGAAVTPDVWVATRRVGIPYHEADTPNTDRRFTTCGRLVRANYWLTLAEALALGAVPCPRCYGGVR